MTYDTIWFPNLAASLQIKLECTDRGQTSVMPNLAHWC